MEDNGDVMKILILTDYKTAFYSSTKNTRTLCTLDTIKIQEDFEEKGYDVEISNFSNVELDKNYRDTYVIYTSSEDRGLKYKSYIEDVILFLKERGGIIIPDFPFLRAHHNKSFMEMLRYKIFPEQAKLLSTKIYGTLEDLEGAEIPEQKYVIKGAYGAGSKFVTSANNKKELLAIAKRISGGCDLEDVASEYKKRIFWKGYQRGSLNRNKFIVQDFIENLKGDFKVLKYGERFYVLYRKNRQNDFRASGSGNLSFTLPETIKEEELLNYAKQISDKIGTPLCSMDIAWDGTEFILIEFQCLCFGPYTAEYSSHCNVFEQEQWKKIYEECCVEDIFCEAIHDHIRSGSGSGRI
jgi:glutathione synthase/RimK-type ligase-like ATP-grasp enzyme